jgi:hypothetical protein
MTRLGTVSIRQPRATWRRSMMDQTSNGYVRLLLELEN